MVFKAEADGTHKLILRLIIDIRKTHVHSVFLCFSQVNNSIHVNSVGVPTSDLMATNGVVHIVKNVLYPGGGDNVH